MRPMKPILFNPEMVRAILNGKKTVTRRVIKPQPNDSFNRFWATFTSENGELVVLMAPYHTGDILYVRETWSTKVLDGACTGYVTGACPYESCENPPGPCFTETGYVYKASDALPAGGKWRPSIHMPKEAARIFLRVTNVRLEQMAEMTPEDFISEGVPWEYGTVGMLIGHARAQIILSERFKEIWNSTIKPEELKTYGWSANPWVWVIRFERCEKPKEE